jgi:pimeloyl-ACP methyl ester carboxylesterase
MAFVQGQVVKSENMYVLNRLHSQLNWEKCGIFECAMLKVPLNYTDKYSKLIEVALKKYPASNPSGKSILINPGGPGVSGNEFVSTTGKYFSNLFEQKYDIIGFDPRGVGNSIPVKCAVDDNGEAAYEAYDVFGVSFLPKDPSLSQQVYFDAGAKLHAQWCADLSGEWIAHISSMNTVRDMESIRVALGETYLNYWGISYGTILGVTYANMYPEKVGSFILDAIVNPQLYYGDIFNHLSSLSRENNDVIYAVARECDSSTACPLYKESIFFLIKDGSSYDMINEFFGRLKKNPMVYAKQTASGIITVDMVEELFYFALIVPAKLKVFLEAISLAIQGYWDMLFELTPVSESKTYVDTNELGSLLSVLCADLEDSSKYSIAEWMEYTKGVDLDFFSGRIGGSQFLGW